MNCLTRCCKTLTSDRFTTSDSGEFLLGFDGSQFIKQVCGIP
jgi:hypothetical protein